MKPFWLFAQGMCGNRSGEGPTPVLVLTRHASSYRVATVGPSRGRLRSPVVETKRWGADPGAEPDQEPVPFPGCGRGGQGRVLDGGTKPNLAKLTLPVIAAATACWDPTTPKTCSPGITGAGYSSSAREPGEHHMDLRWGEGAGVQS